MDSDETARKAWKLIEALAEKCDPPGIVDGEDHSWRLCRRCLAYAELEWKGSRQLMRALLADRAALLSLQDEATRKDAEIERLKSTRKDWQMTRDALKRAEAAEAELASLKTQLGAVTRIEQEMRAITATDLRPKLNEWCDDLRRLTRA